MLYVFHVDTGRMIKFDMNVALSSVQNLKDTIERLYGYPASNIVLLVSGGEMLTPGSLVCSYSAGTDTNPIYMFSTIDIKPQPWPSIEPDVDLTEQVDRCLALPATYSTVVARAQLAQQIYDLAHEEESICERLVYEQHLQQQGWSAVIANMEDLTEEFRQRFENFCKCFEEHLKKRNNYLELLGQFSDDLDKLARIPILPGLMKNAEEEFHGFDEYLNNDEAFSRSHQQNVSVIAATQSTQSSSHKISSSSSQSSKEVITSNDDENRNTGLELAKTSSKECCIPENSGSGGSDLTKIRTLTLLQWITAKENHNTLKIMAEECIQGLTTFDEDKFEKLKQDVMKIIKTAEQDEIKEIKGLEDRLYGLEKLKCELKKLVQEQKELSTAFQQNQSRASNLGDASILPDLCASHRSQLVVMLQNQKIIRDIRRRISRAKDELGANLDKRLKYIVHIENTMSELDNNLLFYHRCLRRVERHLNIIQQIHQTPNIYVSAVTEVVRRRIFSREFVNWASTLACDFYTIHNDEVLRRQEFNTNFEGHFLNALFPGMNDMPPAFANETPFIFDAGLPNITKSDLDVLTSYLPDIISKIQFPDMGPVIEFFVSRSGSKIGESKNSTTSKSQSNNTLPPAIGHRPIDLHSHLKDGFESETDTEEFEKVGQSSNEPQSQTIVTVTIATSTSENIPQTVTKSTSMEVVAMQSVETLTENLQLPQSNAPKKPPRLSKVVNTTIKVNELYHSAPLPTILPPQSQPLSLPPSNIPDIIPNSPRLQYPNHHHHHNYLSAHQYYISTLSKSNLPKNEKSLESSDTCKTQSKIPLYHDPDTVGHHQHHQLHHHHHKQQQQQQQQQQQREKSPNITTLNMEFKNTAQNENEQLSPITSPSLSNHNVPMMINDGEFINSEFYIDESLPSSLKDDDYDIKKQMIKKSIADDHNYADTDTDYRKNNISSSDDECPSPSMQTLDKSTITTNSIMATFNDRKSMDMVLTLLQDNLGSTRLEVENLKCLLKNMSQISSESLVYLRNDLKNLKKDTIDKKDYIKSVIEEFSNIWNRLKNEYETREKDIAENLKFINQTDIEKDLKINELNLLCNDKTAQLASQKEIIENLEKERDTLRDEIKKMNEKISNLQDIINTADLDKEKALTECRERLIHEHKNEIESLRCRFKLMTSMERSPSDTSLEKIEKPDMIEIACHESILHQAREDMNNEKELAIKAAVELERSKWTSGHGAAAGTTETVGDNSDNSQKTCSNTMMNKMELLKKIIEEKDKQLDAFRERDVIRSEENFQLKIKIETLTMGEESDKQWLKERLETLNKEKLRLEQELNMEKSRRQEMESSFATVKGISTALSRDVLGSPDLGGARSKMTSSQSISSKLNITTESCVRGDIVFVVWNVKHGQYTVVQDSTSLYFVHGDSLGALNLKLPSPGEIDMPFPLHCIGKVIDKEYCQARKDENRYKVTKGTRFYRIKLQPIIKMESSRLHHKRERYESSSSSTSVSRSTSTQHLIDSFAQTESSVTHSAVQHDIVDSAVTVPTAIISSISATSSTTSTASLFKERTMSVCSVAEEEDEPISLLSERCHYTSLSEEEEKVIGTDAWCSDADFTTLNPITVTSVSSSTSPTTLITSSTTNQQQQTMNTATATANTSITTITATTTTSTTESSSEKDQDDSDEYRSLEAKDESDFPTTV